MNEITVVVTTFKRPALLQHCLKSIRKMYPVMPILIADNGTKTEHEIAQMKRIADLYDAGVALLPYNCGANRARRDGIAMADSEYVVLIEDDMEFMRTTRLEAFYNVMRRDMSVGLVGGVVETRGRFGAIASKLSIDQENSVFYRTRIDKPDDVKIANGTKYFYCDYVRMFFMVRRDFEIDWEVGLYPSSGSHLSIMLKLLNSKLKKAWTWDCMIRHTKARPTREYAKIRNEYRAKARKIFVDSTGLRYGVFNNGERVEDMLTGKKIAMMELSRRLNEHSKAKSI